MLIFTQIKEKLKFDRLQQQCILPSCKFKNKLYLCDHRSLTLNKFWRDKKSRDRMHFSISDGKATEIKEQELHLLM